MKASAPRSAHLSQNIVGHPHLSSVIGNGRSYHIVPAVGIRSGRLGIGGQEAVGCPLGL